MTEPEGGLRDRLVLESLVEMLRDTLGTLGWFDDVDPAVRLPVNLTSKSYKADEEIPLNTIRVLYVDDDHDDIEIGSLASEDTRTCYVEVYAQDEAVLNHLRGDIVAILRGKHPGCGRTWNTLELTDWTLATPAQFGLAHLDRVRSERSRFFNRPWAEFWIGVRVDIVEERQ